MSNEEYFDRCDWTASKAREVAHIKASLHWWEGGLTNAFYWYRSADMNLPLDKEWQRLVLSFLC
jgi:hypothetical protein